MSIPQGLSLRDACQLARRLGVRVEHIRRTGELRFSVPGVPSVKHNARRKDSSRRLVTLLRRASGPTTPPSRSRLT